MRVVVGNEGMRALDIPFKGFYGYLIPSSPTKSQPFLIGFVRFTSQGLVRFRSSRV